MSVAPDERTLMLVWEIQNDLTGKVRYVRAWVRARVRLYSVQGSSCLVAIHSR